MALIDKQLDNGTNSDSGSGSAVVPGSALW